MAIINYGQGDVEVEVSVETLMIYEQEFAGADMIQDLYKKIVVRKSDMDDDIVSVLDFGIVNWTNLTRVLWAAEKTANPKTKPFKTWCKSIKGINLLNLNRDLIPVIEGGLFCEGDATSDEKQ